MAALMRSLAAAIVSSAFLVAPSAVFGQTQPSSPGLSEPAANLSDQKLDATAAAVMRVASIKQEYEQRIAAAPAADQERIAKEAVAAIAKAVTDQGLSLEEYTAILELAQNSPDIRDKIRARIARAAK
jgi:hypothetical protein